MIQLLQQKTGWHKRTIRQTKLRLETATCEGEYATTTRQSKHFPWSFPFFSFESSPNPCFPLSKLHLILQSLRQYIASDATEEELVGHRQGNLRGRALAGGRGADVGLIHGVDVLFHPGPQHQVQLQEPPLLAPVHQPAHHRPPVTPTKGGKRNLKREPAAETRARTRTC